MKYIILFISCISLCFTFAQTEKQLKVYLDENQFFVPDGGNYLEVHLNFLGYSLNYQEVEEGLQGEVEISQTFSAHDSIITDDKYKLKSPIVKDSIYEDFHDIQKYALSPGIYTYTLSIKDVHSDKEPLSVSKTINIKDYSKGLTFSTIIPAESIVPNPAQQSIFTKAGYDVVPMLGNYYSSAMENLLYYVELYNTNTLSDSLYVVKQKIRNDKDIDMSAYDRYFRYHTTSFQPISKVIDIRELPTGRYSLELEVLNREKEIVAKTNYDFDRNNTEEVDEIAYQSTVLDPAFEESIPLDSAAYYVASLIPISRSAEVKNILTLLKKRDNKENLKYLQAYWREVAPHNAYEKWIQYKGQVQLVERLYATNYQVGFETDRGRVYLQYGSPNTIIEQPSSPTEYPYEIWQYDQISHYSNRRFIFYNRTNVGKQYELLHSDMVGELHNNRWRYALNSRDTPNGDFDDPTGGAKGHFGGNSSRYFETY